MNILLFIGFGVLIVMTGHSISLVRTGKWQFHNDSDHNLEMMFIHYGYPITFVALFIAILAWFLTQGQYLFR